VNWSSLGKLFWNPDRRWWVGALLSGVGAGIGAALLIQHRWMAAVLVIASAVIVREGLYDIFVAKKRR
jgi:integral membrane sensor domain MASE1